MSDDIDFPRVATIMRDTDEVSSIALMEQAPEHHRENGHVYFERVGSDVCVGMRKQADGKYDWPEGHANESSAVKMARFHKEREAAGKKAWKGAA